MYTKLNTFVKSPAPLRIILNLCPPSPPPTTSFCIPYIAVKFLKDAIKFRREEGVKEVKMNYNLTNQLLYFNPASIIYNYETGFELILRTGRLF